MWFNGMGPKVRYPHYLLSASDKWNKKGLDMLAATTHSPEAHSLPPLPLPGPVEAEQELEKADTTSQTATATCQKQRSGTASAAPHNHAELFLCAGWSSNHLESLPTHCTSYTEGVGQWKGKGQSAPSSTTLTAPVPLCHH